MTEQDERLLTAEEILEAEIEANASVPAYGSGATEHRKAVYLAIQRKLLVKIDVCPECEGSGENPDKESIVRMCLKCQGTGRDNQFEKLGRESEEAIRKDERERVFKDIDNAGLIGEHTGSSLHSTGAMILDCPACCWYAYKAK